MNIFKDIPRDWRPDFMRGYRCEICNQSPQLILKAPEASTEDPLAVNTTIAVKCKCHGAWKVAAVHESSTSELVSQGVHVVFSIYKFNMKKTIKSLKPVPAGRTLQQHFKIVQKFLEERA